MSDGFYRPYAEKESRSLMNLTFKLPNDEIEAQFIEEAKLNKIVGIKGHRSIGGLRASLYNSMTIKGCEKLSEFLIEFKEKHLVSAKPL